MLYSTLAGLAEIDATGRLGLPILAAVLLVALVVERVLDGATPAVALRALGFGRPDVRALCWHSPCRSRCWLFRRWSRG